MTTLPAAFGKYELLEAIGSGGMADVYLARSFGVAGFEKRLVLKCIKPQHARDPRFVASFIHEAKIGVSLNHPNIVSVYELGKVGETWFISMEHLQGRDLNKVSRALRAQDRRMDPAMAVRVVAEVARGLAFAHAAGGPDRVAVVHRDVSPHNVFLTFTGEVKLVDFGIARLLGEVASAEEAPHPVGAGKFAYMSPEQVSGRAVDARTDIFSAGIVLWELIVGERLFQADDPEEKLRRVREAVVPHPSDRGVGIDEALWVILKRALSRDPDRRHETAALFEEDLRGWLYALPERPGRAAIASLVGDLFPEDRAALASGVDLKRLADDLARIGAAEAAPTSASGTGETPAAGGVRASDDENKQVVVLVIDIDGFTDVSLQAEPERLFTRHLQLLRWLRRVVDEHGGTIQRVHDDQAFVLFGLPRTRSDDVVRAADCAVALLRRLPEVHDVGVQVQLAMGLHVGEVTVGHAGRKARIVARGDTMRLARRLSELADHQQILASEALSRMIGDRFALTPGPPLRGRGGKAPGTSSVISGRRAESATHRGPWIRRGNELELIREALARLEGEQGAALLLHGDVGSGKSRLMREFAEVAKRGRIPIYAARASPFAPPGTVVRTLVLALLGLAPDADADSIARHTPRLRQLTLSTRDVEALEVLTGVRQGRLDAVDAWIVLRRAIAAAATSPTVVLLEDAHHLPARELPALALLVERLAQARVMVLLTATGAVPTPLADIQQVHLGPLPAAAQARLISARLDARVVAPELLDRIAASCEGNPLYIGEMLTFLVERSLVEVVEGEARLVGDPGTAFPDTLAALIAARIDELDPASKGALQVAAVLGGQFTLQQLGEVIGLDDPEALVAELSSRALVRPSEGRDAFALASDLVRDTVLRGVLGVQRRDYHRLVAAAMERNLDGFDLERREALALHCGRAGRLLDAARYSEAAGRAHELAGELALAQAAYRTGISWLENPDALAEDWSERVQIEATLRLRLGTASKQIGDRRAGERSLLLSLEVAEEAGLGWVEVQAHLELGGLHHLNGKPARALAHLQAAWERLRTQNDHGMDLLVLDRLTAVCVDAGREADALRWSQLRLDRAESAAERADAGLALANVHAHAGRLDDARRVLDQARLEAAESDDPRVVGRVLGQVGLVHLWADDVDAAITVLREAVRATDDLGAAPAPGHDHRWLGDAHVLRGDTTRAVASFERGRELADEAGWQEGVMLHDLHLAFLTALRGEDSGAGARLAETVAAAEAQGHAEAAATGTWLAGRLAMLAGRFDEADATLMRAAESAQRGHMVALVLAIARTRSRLTRARTGLS